VCELEMCCCGYMEASESVRDVSPDEGLLYMENMVDCMRKSHHRILFAKLRKEIYPRERGFVCWPLEIADFLPEMRCFPRVRGLLVATGS